MNKTPTIRSLGWLIGLILFFSWNLQAESNPPHQSVQFTKFFNVPTPPLPPDPDPPISRTATVGQPFRLELPDLLPNRTSISVTGIPANGLHFETSLPPAIQGEPLTAGVMNLTLVNGSPTGTAWRAIIITVNPDPNPPISRTATVGQPFRLELPDLLPNRTSISVTGIPANGLHFETGLPPAIQGEPLTAGVMNLTLVNGSPTGTAWRAIIITVNPDPNPPLPPDPDPPISRTATVGQPFRLELPDLLPNRTSISVTGIPANGLHFETSLPPAIQGEPLTAGVMNLTLVNGSPTGTAWRAIIITVNSGPGSALTLLAPTYNCATGAFRFNTSGGDGSPITFFAIGITGPTTNPDQFVDTDQRTASDAPPILLQATQNGTTVTYLWDIRAQCPVNQPGGTLSLLAPTYNCATGAFRFNTSGGDGSPITFSAIGITGPTTNPDQFVDTDQRTAADAQPLHLQANQSGVTVTYVWDIRAQCPLTPPPPGSALTLLAPTYNCATGAFRFNTSGGDGSPITFFAIGITGLTTNPDQFVDTELRTVNDVQPILLQATQNGTTVTYLWNLKAACGRARLSAVEPERRLSVKLLGNPVVGDIVHIEVRGAEGQPLLVALINQQGRPVSEARIVKATAVERLEVKLSRSPGVHLLQVSTLDQTEVVRVVKTD
jgi:hypothetical protein